jgi:hypothetical protein
MLPSVQKLALQAMDDLMNHPITQPFHKALDPPTAPAGYFERIERPQYLLDIRARLAAAKFPTLQSLFEDIDLVWQNAESFHGRSSPFTSAAQQCRRVFAKLKRGLDRPTVKSWCAEVTRLRQKELRLTVQSPPRILAIASSQPEFRAIQRKDGVRALSEREIQHFLDATELITSEAHLRDMLKIMNETQPKLNLTENATTVAWVDISKLNVATIMALKDYMKGVLEKQGMQYPE